MTQNLEMTATQELLDAAMAKLGLTTHYQLARATGVSHQRMANWRNKGTECDDEAAALIATSAGLKVAESVLKIAASRVKNPKAREALADEAKRLAA